MPTLPPRALVVDDEESIRLLLVTFLNREGFAVDCAASFSGAEALLTGTPYDLVMIDIYLGKNSGIELLRRVRDCGQEAQVVLITGNPNVDSAAEALRLGAFDYLVKPFTPYQVVGTARRALRTKRLTEENRRNQANLDAIFRSATDSIILVDREGCLIQANEAARRSCCFTPGHFGMPVREIQSGCSGECRELLLAVLADGQPRSRRRLECQRHDGIKRVFSLSTSPVLEDDGGIGGVVAILRDDTELVSLENQLGRQCGLGNIVGGNSAMRRLYTLIEALANVQTTVLINGESGTGKELVADALHELGNRRDKPFIKFNCSAFSDNLLESELFGHVRGAFTGAVASRTGRFLMADGGTIFLDEIGDISAAMQMRLLRVLQEQEFEPVGSSVPIRVDVRVVAATNQDLAEKVRLGTFRQDLYYRLNVVRLIIPPLRERLDDVPLLTDHLLKRLSRKFRRNLAGVSPEVLEMLMCHSWPGNVRELEHVLEHAALLCGDDQIARDHLPLDFLSLVPSGGFPGQDPAGRPAPELSLQEALVRSGGNKAKAARLLGISRCTLYRRIKNTPVTS